MYFKRSTSTIFPTAEKTGLPAHAVNSANSVIQNHLKQGDSTKNGRKRKSPTQFISEERAKVGKYAGENGTARA